MSSMYMFLPSNVFDISGKNTIGNYTTHLPQTFHFTDEWEVGVSEILITKTWFNVQKGEVLFWNQEKGIAKSNVFIKEGCYRSIFQLQKAVNRAIEQFVDQTELDGQEEEIIKPPQLLYDPTKQKFFLTPGRTSENNIFMPIFPETVRAILGYEMKFDYDPSKTYSLGNEEIKGGWEAERSPDIDAAIKLIYVYCDLVKPSVVGNTFSKLIRIVNFPDTSFGETIQQIYTQPLYFTVAKNYFNTIEFDLKDDAGETLKFDSGRVTILLHLRKK